MSVYPLLLLFGRNDPYIRKIPVFMGIVESVSDNKFIRDDKSRVIHIHILLTSLRLIQKGTQFNRLRSALLQIIEKVAQRISRIDNIFHNKNVSVLDRIVKILRDLYYSG